MRYAEAMHIRIPFDQGEDCQPEITQVRRPHSACNCSVGSAASGPTTSMSVAPTGWKTR